MPIETLDDAMNVPRLKKLFLLGCEQLCSLHWDGDNPKLEVLHVDTRGEGKMSGLLWKTERFVDIETSFTDERFIWSVMKTVGHEDIFYVTVKLARITKTVEVIAPAK